MDALNFKTVVYCKELDMEFVINTHGDLDDHIMELGSVERNIEGMIENMPMSNYQEAFDDHERTESAAIFLNQ